MRNDNANGAGTLLPGSEKIKKKSTVRFRAKEKPSDYRPKSQADTERIEAINRAFRSLKGGAL